MAKDQIIKKLSALRKVVIALLLNAALLAIVIITYSLGGMEGFSLKYYDLLFRMRGEQQAQSNIIIVELDAKYKDAFRTSNAPVSREYSGKLLKTLSDNGAFIVAYDQTFLKPDWSPDGDAVFSQAINDCYDNEGAIVILASKYDPNLGLITPIDILDADNGLINLKKDGDGVVRRMRPLFPIARVDNPEIKDLYGAFSTWVTAYYENIAPDQWRAGSVDDDFVFQLGDKSFLDEDYYINFSGGRQNYTYISAYDVLKGDIDYSNWVDAIFLIADTTGESQDFYLVPYREYSNRYKAELAAIGVHNTDKTSMPGVEVHANAIQTLIDNSWIKPVDMSTVIAIVILVGLIIGALFYLPWIPNWASAIVLVIALGAEVLTSKMMFSSYLWFDMVPIFITTILIFGGGMLYKNLVLAKANRKVAGMFGQYVSPNIVEKLLDEGDISLSGKTQDVTVLFSDIRGFTPISEKLTPEEIGVLLNTYFDAMIKIVFANDGTLDKLMGDAIMAFFGDPVPFDDHPAKACRTALAMMKKLNEMKANPPVPGMEMVNIGIGMNSGIVTVGDLGSFEYRDYTVIGDNVNLGSRVEGINKMYGTNIILTELTRDRVAGLFEMRKLDAVRVKGKSEPVIIYELLGEKGQVEDEMMQRKQRFEEGLDLYMHADFSKALPIFKELVEKYDDGPAATFLHRAEEFITKPPEGEWDGVYTATSK